MRHAGAETIGARALVLPVQLACAIAKRTCPRSPLGRFADHLASATTILTNRLRFHGYCLGSLAFRANLEFCRHRLRNLPGLLTGRAILRHNLDRFSAPSARVADRCRARAHRTGEKAIATAGPADHFLLQLHGLLALARGANCLGDHNHSVGLGRRSDSGRRSLGGGWWNFPRRRKLHTRCHGFAALHVPRGPRHRQDHEQEQQGQ